MEEQRNKISDVEAILLIIGGLIADIINWIPGINVLVGIVVFPITQLYFRAKEVKGTYSLVGNIIELIPFLSVLPAYTAAFAVTIYVDRHPKVATKAVVITKLVSAPKASLPSVDSLKKAT